jgi:tetratricopeptide (TPR) repeat protein
VIGRRVGLIAALVLAGSATAHAQFNPEGRTKKKPAAGARSPAPRVKTPAKPNEGTVREGAKPPAATRAPAGSKAPDAAAERGPAREALMARYLGAALAQPGAEFPLERLAELYRSRDGNLNALIAELEKRAAGSADERYPALVALAGLDQLEGRLDQALERYAKASRERPQSPAAELAIARLLERRGDRAGARTHFEQGLSRTKDDAEREQILRSLRSLSLDLGDAAAAARYHDELVKRASGSFFVRAELGRDLLARGQHDRAVEELRKVVAAAAGDNRVLAPALRDLGLALSRAGRRKEALVELERALGVAGATAGVRREVLTALTEVYRADDRIPELVSRLEKSGRSPEELRLLALLYEEQGRIDKALAVHRKVLAREPGDVATRLKVVSLLEAQGSLEQAIAEYESLIRAAPRNPEYVFRLVSALLERGDRARALVELGRLEARAGTDEDLLSALVEYYQRIGEKDRSVALLERLAASGSRDPEHLVELGTRYYAAGDKARARATWQRIRQIGTDRVRALLTLGEVLLEHDLTKEALEALEEAAKLEPGASRAERAYALGLERAGGAAPTAEARRALHDQALALWEKLLRESSTKPELAREARQHVVTLWGLRGQLTQRMIGLSKRFGQNPPDLEAGRLLAEAEIRLRRNADAERTLRKLIDRSPGDQESLERLERVLVLERKLSEAIKVLERLVVLEPKRSREYHQRMAEYSAELYRDDDAIRYAARAVELGPDDAEGHAKLGRMYRRRQQPDKAIQELRQAISKNDRAFPVYLELSELLLEAQKLDEADQLLRRVIRAATDEELVSRAARLAIQLNLGRGTLEGLEKEILPLALGNPDRPLYRRLLVEIYGALAYPLVHRARTGSAADATAARASLERLGERAVKPLLDALSDDRATQQQVAITLLSHVGSRAAGPALLAYAAGNAESDLRTRAVIAAGTLKDPALLPRFRALLAPDDRLSADYSDPVAVAVAWSVARLSSREARSLLVSLLDTDAPSLRALGALGLGVMKDQGALPLLSRVARSGESGNVARAAAVRALAMLGARNENEVLAELSRSPDKMLRENAILALAELRAAEAADAIAEALIDADTELRTVAGLAAAAYSTRSYRAPKDPLPPPEARVDLSAVLHALRPGPYTQKERIDSLEALAPMLSRAATTLALSSPERARSVVEALGLTRGGTPLPALVGDVQGQDRERVERALAPIGAALVPVLGALVRHPYAPVRVTAVEFLGQRTEPDAREALLGAVNDNEPSVRRAVLAAATPGNARLVSAIAARLAVEPDWGLRVSVTEALGRTGRGAPEVAVAALVRTLQKDEYALVREAAARALHAVDERAARPHLESVKKHDPEPRVREVAWKLLGGSP